METIHQNNGICINFFPHTLGSFYQIILKKKALTIEDNLLEELSRTSELSKKLNLLDPVFYSSLSALDVKNIGVALKQVYEDYKKGLQKFIDAHRKF